MSLKLTAWAACTCPCGFVGYLTNRQFFMVCTLIDHRNNVKMYKTQVKPGTARGQGLGVSLQSFDVLTSFLWSICFLPRLKRADTSQRRHWFPREMTTEKGVQKFHTDDASLPRTG